MPIDGVSFEEKAGYMVRSMRLIPTNKVSTDNIRVNEAAQEIMFRSVKGGAEGTEERSWRGALNRNAVRFTVVKCPPRCESIGRYFVSWWGKYLTPSTKRRRT